MALRDQILACAVRVVEAKKRKADAEAEEHEAEAEYDKLLREAGLTGHARAGHANGASPQPERKTTPFAPETQSLQERVLRLVKEANAPISTDDVAEALQWDKVKVGWALQALQSKRKEIKRAGRRLWAPA
jgi:hypothetical protein